MITKPKHLQPRVAILCSGMLKTVWFGAEVGDLVDGFRITGFYGRARVEGVEYV